jgi:hypothetical protein
MNRTTHKIPKDTKRPTDTEILTDTKVLTDTLYSHEEQESHEAKGMQEVIGKAILAALPQRNDKHHKQVFNLCRHLKGVPELSKLPADELLPFVEQWHTAALSTGFLSSELFLETRMYFVLSWDKVNIPALEMSLLMEIADANREQVYGVVGFDRLLSLCRELQKFHGENPFFLGCRKAGELLGVSYKQASTWLCFLEYEGHIKTIVQGTKTPRKASEYRYLGGKKE